MLLEDLHPWELTPRKAMALQVSLAPRIVREGAPGEVRYVAAGDVAFTERRGRRQPALARAAAVLLCYPALEVVEHHVVESPVSFPYVPGLLSFREIPLLAKVFARLSAAPDMVLVDGHGYSHPRRFGIASHLGLLAGIPTIGVAKSRLCGEHAPVSLVAGSRAPLEDRGEVIGLVLRTRDSVAPVYVSVGHLIALSASADWVLRLCRSHRLPEPIRLADRLSKGKAL